MELNMDRSEVSKPANTLADTGSAVIAALKQVKADAKVPQSLTRRNQRKLVFLSKRSLIN